MQEQSMLRISLPLQNIQYRLRALTNRLRPILRRIHPTQRADRETRTERKDLDTLLSILDGHARANHIHRCLACTVVHEGGLVHR